MQCIHWIGSIAPNLMDYTAMHSNAQYSITLNRTGTLLNQSMLIFDIIARTHAKKRVAQRQ